MMNTRTNRRIKKVWPVTVGENIVLYVLCEDDTLWTAVPWSKTWTKMPAIPEDDNV